MHEPGLMDFSPFRREWVVRGRNFGDGQVEVTAIRFDRYVGAQGLSTMPKAKRGESQNTEDSRMSAAKRAKQQVRLRCKAIGADRMITLTYRENMLDKDRLKHDFDSLRRRLGKVMDFRYVAVAERQKRGAWHLHIAVRGRQNYRMLRSIWLTIVGDDNGFVQVRNPFREKGLRHKLASYLSKYITKDFAEHSLNEKRYWTSKCVEIRERHAIAHLLSDDPTNAIVTAFEAAQLAGAPLDRCQTFWSQELGCFWLATREN
ncbi:bacteriophage-related protein [Pandoraea iniqua]|uniref:rolling circle replication-associated protein n=1 Tax=Pandoraea iniqua TaxID=2508288 RepID=UPI00123F563C|nr:hypothetical protein [Pandoraea iniqua]VVE18502.1 bacteriophage-related protein [Pandoraea iniqua]